MSSAAFRFAFVVLLAMTAGPALAPATVGAEPEQPPLLDDEQRSVILELEGYADLAEDETLKEIRQEALSNAKRQAVEAAGSTIRSKTRVENFVVDFDQVVQQAEGRVQVLEMEDMGVQPDNRYKVRIKAEVEFVLRPKTDEAAQEMTSNPDGPLTVRVWSEAKTYRAGEKIRLKLQANRDCFLRVVDVMPDGNIVQLLPNAHRRYTHFKGGRVYEIPGPGDRFDLTVTPPFGTDEIKVYASEKPLGEASMTPLQDGLGLYRGTQAQLGSRLRGVQVAPTDKASAQSAEFVEATWRITTRP